jgi:hypothetical protein
MAQETPETRKTPLKTEQSVPSSTDKEDLSATLHNTNIPISDEENEEEIVYEDDVSQEYTESYGTGAYPEPGKNVGTS